MNDQIVTSDLAEFGYRELGMAGDLLKAFAENPPEWLGEGVRVYMNKNSGCVFLASEDDGEVAMMNGEKLDRWHSCPDCGWEGFADDYEFDSANGNTNECCREYMIEVGAIKA